MFEKHSSEKWCVSKTSTEHLEHNENKEGRVCPWVIQFQGKGLEVSVLVVYAELYILILWYYKEEIYSGKNMRGLEVERKLNSP